MKKQREEKLKERFKKRQKEAKKVKSFLKKWERNKKTSFLTWC